MRLKPRRAQIINLSLSGMSGLFSYKIPFFSFFLFSLFIGGSDIGFILRKLIWDSFFPAKTEIVATLEINKTVSNSTPLTGETFTYTIQYSCASTVDTCKGTMITDPLPAALEFVGMTGSSHTINEVYNSGSHTVTFTFQNNLLAGSTGEVQIQVRFPNGSTANGTVANNTATISATNATSVVSSVSATAVASAKPIYEKALANGGVAGGNSTYQMMICNTGNAVIENGTLNLESVTVVDTLPANTVYLEYAIASGITASYDAPSHAITYTFPTVEPGVCYWVRVTVQNPSAFFSLGDNVSNTACVNYTPVGEIAVKECDTISHTLIAPDPSAHVDKTISNSNPYQGEPGEYQIKVGVYGTEQIDDFCIIDSIPAGFEIIQINKGGYYSAGLSISEYIVNIYYTTNLTGRTLITGSPFSVWDPNNAISVENDLGLTIGGPEYITVLEFCYGDVPSGFASYSSILLGFDIRTDAPVGLATNCAKMSTSTSPVTLENSCVDATVQAAWPGAIADPYSWVVGKSAGTTYNIGDTIELQLRLKNGWIARDSIEDPTMYCFLPEELSYIPGSWYIPSPTTFGNIPGAPTPAFNQTDNFNASGRTLLSWSFSGAASFSFAPSAEFWVYAKAVIGTTAVGGDNSFKNDFILIGGNVNNCWGVEFADTYDIDNDANTAELMCYDTLYFDINSVVSLESEKLVKGQLDSTYTKYPNSGSTVPGGLSDYKLLIKNSGNIAMTNIVVIDILPSVGDVGVIDPSARNSRWRPNLVDTVNAPSGVTVYYSTQANPCRSAEGIDPSGPVGCTSAGWTSSPPADITTVQSLKFDFGATTLPAGDTLTFEWPMRAPITAINTIGSLPDTIAWSSFAFIANRADNGESLLPAEPVKVGMAMGSLVPGVVGNLVWDDTDGDGIQDSGESGLDGIRVELYQDNGDAITDISTDSLVSFTLTTDGGLFLFSNLETNDYYLSFSQPDGYRFSPEDQEITDTLDSDGIARIYLGDTIAVTPITNILNMESDLSWDQGVQLGSQLIPPEICNNGVDDDGDGLIDCLGISGTIFEDVNYGGGIGRDYTTANTSAQASGWASGVIRVQSATVELYNTLGAFVSSTTTNASGVYTFSEVAAGTYSVRVVNGSVNSNRGSNSTGETIIPVQTFRSDGTTAVTNEIGGANPALVDANANGASANLSTLTTASATPQSVTLLNINSTDITDVDFGFNFDVIVNTNDSGHGSFRQFVLNSNELNNTNLDQEDNPTSGVSFPKAATWETSIFMIPGGGVKSILPLTEIDWIEDPKTHISGYTQSGATQGTISARTLMIELNGNANTFEGLTIYTDSIQVSGMSIYDFDSEIYSYRPNTIYNFIWGNYFGVKADGTKTVGFNGNGVYFSQVNDSYIGTDGNNINDVNEGNLISNGYYGVYLRNNDNVLVAGNYVGTDETGLLDFGNRYNGIYIRDALGANCIGFKDDAINTNPDHFRNLISGNGNDGVRIDDADDQVVAGNFIGTNITLTTAIKNDNYGIQIQGTSSNTVIGTNSNGDDDAKERNIISGNATGLRTLSGGTGMNTKIAGNYIGVDSTGNVPLPNENNGVEINGTFTGTIIGTNGDNINDEIESNVISGNLEDGIRIFSSNDNIIAGNKIGVGADGVTPVGNLKRGIFIVGTTSDNTIGYSSGMLNANELIVGNQIKNNDDSGIGFSGTGTGNRVSRNQTANNSSLGIDLEYNGVTTNDNGDTDNGVNNLLNFPVLDTAYLLGNNLTVSGFAPASASIEFFIADDGPSPNPLPVAYTSSFGEGAIYLFTYVEGSADDNDATTSTYTNDGTGASSTKTENRFEFTIDISGLSLTNNTNLTTSSTDASNNTSEFSGWMTINVIEICNDGIDNDGDGLLDCFDCNECYDEATCNDNDADGVGDYCDLDDDNDGIPDENEASSCFPAGRYVEDNFFFDDFGTGTNIDSSTHVLLCLEDGTNPCGLYDTAINDGEYNIADTPRKFNINTDWTGLGDHTGNTNGRMLVINADYDPDTFYVRPISGFIKNVNVTGSFWARNTIIPGSNVLKPNITAKIVDEMGTVLDTLNTGDLPEDETWHEFSISADPGSADIVYLILVNNGPGGIGNDLALDDISFSQFVCDCDDDGIANHLDLDSDNDGIYDLDEAGHTQSDTNTDGVIDNANTNSGINGLFDNVETTPESGIINYTISDSEASPDGIYDICELDSDGDGCFDTYEEAISDSDEDGLAGAGTPTVDVNTGLVNTITYASPSINIWQNPLIAPCNCLLNITDVSVSTCLNDGSTVVATVDVIVAWSDPVLADSIWVIANGDTITIDVPGGAVSPDTVQFVVPANGSTGNVIQALFSRNECLDSDGDTYDAPAGGCAEPFDCLRTAYMTHGSQNNTDLSSVDLAADPNVFSLIADYTDGRNGLAFNPLDNFLYAFPQSTSSPSNNGTLERIDQNGSITVLSFSTADSLLMVGNKMHSATFLDDGTLISIEINASNDAITLWQIEVSGLTPTILNSYSMASLGATANLEIWDIHFDPFDQLIYAFNQTTTELWTFDPDNGFLANQVATFSLPDRPRAVGATWVDFRGIHWIYGSDVSDGLYYLWEYDALANTFARGTRIISASWRDGTACASGNYLEKTIGSTCAAPGDTVTYTFKIYNSTGDTRSLTLTDTLPNGMTYVPGTFVDTTGTGTPNSYGNTNILHITGLDITFGTATVRYSEFTIDVVIPDTVTSTIIYNQAYLQDISGGYPTTVISDFPETVGGEPDATPLILTYPTINRSQNTACINETITMSSSDIGAGATYTWDFGTEATPDDTTGIGPFDVLYTSCGNKTVSLTIEKDGCSFTVDSILQIIDNTDPVWDVNPQNLVLECNSSKNLNDSISLWLANFGNGVASDNCASINISNDYTGLTADCGTTGSTTVQFTAADSCGNSVAESATIQILDTQEPVISPVNDITVDCETVPIPPIPSATDSCDVNPDLTYQGVAVYHPNADWKNIGTCDLIHAISDAVYDNNGTPGSPADDEMTFTLTVIGQNTGTGWSTNIEGVPFSGAYYTSVTIGPFLSNGSTVNFTLTDTDDSGCSIVIALDAADF